MSYLKESLNLIDKLALSGVGGIGPTICYAFRGRLQISLLILNEFKGISYLVFLIKSSGNLRWNRINSLNPLQPGCFSIPPENIRKPKGFLMFSGGIEKQHRAVMG